MEHKKDLDIAILPKMEVILAHLNWIPLHKLVITDPAQVSQNIEYKLNKTLIF